MDICVASTGTPNKNIMAVVVAVTTLFSKRTLEFWIFVVGHLGVVKFLYLNFVVSFSAFNVWTTIIQEAEVVVLQV